MVACVTTCDPMISLKKHIDRWDEAFRESAFAAYRSLLMTIAACGRRAVPDLGEDLEKKLSMLNEALSGCHTAEELNSTHQNARNELSQWAEQAWRREMDSEREWKEIVVVMSKAVGTLSQRDGRYAREVGDVSERLRTIAGLNDLAAIRRSVADTAGALSTCVRSIAQ